MSDYPMPSPLETQILRVIWKLGSATVSDVHQSMDDGRERAYTTVLTVLQNLEKKGLVNREKRGRSHLYEAAYPSSEVIGALLEDFVRNVYGGDWHELFQHVLVNARLTSEQKDELMEQWRPKAQNRPIAAKKATPKSTKKVAKKK